MKKLIGILMGLSVTVCQADVIGFSVGAQYWNYDVKGDVRTSVLNGNNAAINFNDNNDFNLFVLFEHPVPFLPNIKLQQNNIQASGLIPVQDASFLNGALVNVSGDVDLSHTDLTLYYEVLDNWVNLDVGLSAKYFDGYMRFNYENAIDDESDFDDFIPMVYVKAQFDLPFTGFSVAATAEALSFKSSQVTDLELAIKYQNDLGLGIDLGYRNLDVDLENINSFDSDLQADGFYLGGSFSF